MKNVFNWGTIFSLLVLFIYSYIMFLGLMYGLNGEIKPALQVTIIFIVLVFAMLMLLRVSKASRYGGRRKKGQILSGFIMLVLFFFSAFPFTNFMQVLEQKDKIESTTREIYQAAREIDRAYIEYVDNRIANFKKRLTTISQDKLQNTTDYQQCVERAYGRNDEEKIDNICKSLKRRLLPQSIADRQNDRQKWLANAQESVLNMQMATNMAKIGQQVGQIADGYSKLSSTIYMGEQTEPFTYAEIQQHIDNLTTEYANMNDITFWGVFWALAAYFIILLPYFLTKKSLASRT